MGGVTDRVVLVEIFRKKRRKQQTEVA